MRLKLFLIGVGAAALSACGGGDASGGNAAGPDVPEGASEAAGTTTIAAGLDQNGRFFQAAKASGLDATLAGPGPYTVLAPDDAAFGKLPAGAMDGLMQPAQRARLTNILTYHILPGTVLAADIGKAIDNARGKAILATMGGETLTATRDGEAIILTDGAGAKARVTQADQQRSNGVVHVVDTVLMPGGDAGGDGEATPAG